MLTADSYLLHIERASLYNILSRQRPFHSTKYDFSKVCLIHCNLWGVIQQRVCQSQSYNVNELKCAYGVAQWH